MGMGQAPLPWANLLMISESPLTIEVGFLTPIEATTPAIVETLPISKMYAFARVPLLPKIGMIILNMPFVAIEGENLYTLEINSFLKDNKEVESFSFTNALLAARALDSYDGLKPSHNE